MPFAPRNDPVSPSPNHVVEVQSSRGGQIDPSGTVAAERQQAAPEWPTVSDYYPDSCADSLGQPITQTQYSADSGHRPRNTTEEHISTTGSSHTTERQIPMTATTNSPEEARLHRPLLEYGDEDPSPVSAMGTSVPDQQSRNHGQVNQYYGESSLISLIRGVVRSSSSQRDRVVNRLEHGSIMPPPNASTQFNGPDTNVPISSLLQTQYALPPRDVADHLLGLYFSSVHIFYPWIYSPKFRAAYEAIWLPNNPSLDSGGKPDIGLGSDCCSRDVFFCALNAMFALGCEFSAYSSADKDMASSVFLERIRSLLRYDVLDSGDMSHVQALLLVGQYLLCTHYPSQCWNVIGLACRMAIGLGLQSPYFLNGLSHLEIEMRRRIWHACVQMDMCVSSTSPASTLC